MLPALSRVATAQAYPSRPVRLIVGFSGGPTDITARVMAQWLSERLGQQVVVDNRAGAGSNIAAEGVVNAPPDGYTLLLVGATNAINATLYEKLNFNFIRDIAPVCGIIRVPLIMEVHPSVPVKTVAEFIAYAKAHPGKINMGSGGIGTTLHVSGELFKMMTGVDMLHVPYRGAGPMLTDLLGGQVQVAFDPMPSSIGYVKAGQLRPLLCMGRIVELCPSLAYFSQVPRGWIPGFCDTFQRVGDLVIEHMRIAQRALDIGVVERALHQLDVAGRAQELGSEIMSVVVKPESDHARFLAQQAPISLHPGIGQRVALTPHPAIPCPLRDVGEDEFGMVPLQWPDNFADGRRERCRDALVALAKLDDLPGAEIDFGPAQKAFFEPQAGGTGKGEERDEIIAHGGVELIRFVVG